MTTCVAIKHKAETDGDQCKNFMTNDLAPLDK